MSKLPEKSLLQKLSEVMKPYLANYLIWYYSDPDQRCSWDELCSYDQNFKQKGENAGQNKTQEFCEQNWLIRDDVQKGMIIYMQHMKRFNFMKRYQEMNQILDRVNKFGDAYEVVYVDNGVIKSKVLDSSCCYPVYDDMGEYLAFIESWTDVFTSVTYWNVYYPNYVEHWSNEGAEEHMISTTMAVGLPIHYHNFSDADYNFGESLLTDIKPILDELEDILSKLGDAIYVNSLNVMPVAIGQRIESSIPADATGYVLNLDAGDFKYANCNMDYNTIKLYLDNLKQMLNDISCIPSVLGSNTNIANVSSVAMQILYAMAQVNGDETKKWLNVGFRQRFERFQRILSMQGIKVDSDVDVIYNVSMPVATTEMIANLKALQEMGAISKETIMEKSDIVSDVEVEKSRLGAEYIEDDVVE